MEVVMSKEELLTVPELATALRVPDSWVYGETRKTGSGSIPCEWKSNMVPVVAIQNGPTCFNATLTG